MHTLSLYFQNGFQRGLGIFAVLYLLFLFGVVVVNSMQRTSVLSGSLASTDSLSQVEGRTALSEGTKIQLRDFNRVEVREGKPVWEIRAKEARYFASSSVVLVSDADLTVYQSDGSKTFIGSKGAKLHLKDSAVERVELEGDVKVELSGSFVAKTQYAAYLSGERGLSAPGLVKLAGDGYSVEGVGFHMNLESGEVNFLGKVKTFFTPGAEVPKSAQAFARS